MHNLAAASGMADVNGVLQIQMPDHRGKIVGIVIHIVAVMVLVAYCRPSAPVGQNGLIA